ncbi:MAG: chemotaxis protein CheY [Gammaproteobacteria bacterium SG8_11]|nr:MAG: chemotaxis protein CheY [Gammaproteobacteria bacterium SG8_11]
MENRISKPRILVVDDDREIRDLLSQFLQKHDYHVSVAADGAAMWAALNRESIDLIVLDLMLPGDDGLTLCRQLRNANNLPIIMLTALGEDTDRIVGLEMGADDYLAKPFNQRELLARIKAVLRRSPSPAAANSSTHSIQSLNFEGWSLNLQKRELYRQGDVLVPLTAGEYELLLAFLEHPQQVLNRDQLLDLTKGRTLMPFDRSIDVQISRLRRKVEPDSKNPTLIKTVRSGGYIFTAMVEKH